MTRKQKGTSSNDHSHLHGSTQGARSASTTQSSAEITHEQIAARAYEIFQARGGEPGNDKEDWYQAERELRLGKH